MGGGGAPTPNVGTLTYYLVDNCIRSKEILPANYDLRYIHTQLKVAILT